MQHKVKNDTAIVMRKTIPRKMPDQFLFPFPIDIFWLLITNRRGFLNIIQCTWPFFTSSPLGILQTSSGPSLTSLIFLCQARRAQTNSRSKCLEVYFIMFACPWAPSIYKISWRKYCHVCSCVCDCYKCAGRASLCHLESGGAAGVRRQTFRTTLTIIGQRPPCACSILMP